jgi:hypothetical protein
MAIGSSGIAGWATEPVARVTSAEVTAVIASGSLGMIKLLLGYLEQ